MEFYTSEKVNENLTCIRSKTGELMYLLEGDTRCALIDSCFGVGNLRNYVESLTDKPIVLFLTHGHVDHAMGAPEFETVYMSHRDIPLYQSQCTMEERKGYAGAALGPAAAQLTDTDFTISQPDKEFEDIADGMTFDIAPFHLDAYAFPGHTKGSMIFLIREMKILILGDTCNNATFLFDPMCPPLSVYQQTLTANRERLQGKYDRVFISHHVMEADTCIMDQVIEVCKESLAGEADDLLFEFMGMKAYIAKKCNERFEREDGKFGNIIYNKQKLYEEG